MKTGKEIIEKINMEVENARLKHIEKVLDLIDKASEEMFDKGVKENFLCNEQFKNALESAEVKQILDKAELTVHLHGEKYFLAIKE